VHPDQVSLRCPLVFVFEEEERRTVRCHA
jgi:hypothetical protein